MFKVNITKQNELAKFELFLDGVHAQEWINNQSSDSAYELVDLKQDPSWVENNVKEKRKNEYPEINEVIEALLEVHEGRPEKLTEIMLKREAIKIKYPKGAKNE